MLPKPSSKTKKTGRKRWILYNERKHRIRRIVRVVPLQTEIGIQKKPENTIAGYHGKPKTIHPESGERHPLYH